MAHGQLCMVLHAHLPYVRHPEFPHFMEERWLFEALTECYLPLLEQLEQLETEGIAFGLTLVMSPTLVHMLRDELLMNRFDSHLGALERLAESEERRNSSEPRLRGLARFYVERFASNRSVWDGCGRDVVGAMADLEMRGRLEIMTCAATHGLLPLIMVGPEAARAQVRVGAASHRHQLGRCARGMWLPECGFAPGVDGLLADEGIRFTVLETHGLLNASVTPRFGVHAPVYTPTGVAVFGRDPASSRQVWSARTGYPGDFEYRDFYRDIGFDLAPEQLGELAHPDGIRLFTGIKYHRITHDGGIEGKELYDPRAAAERASWHARDFVHSRSVQMEKLSAVMDRRPVVVAPYDAELFGHWWFEGPRFLAEIARHIHRDGIPVELATLAMVLREQPINQCVQPSASTWGAGGYHEVWIDGRNSWLVRHLTRASRMMVDLTRRHPGARGLERRALCQSARELLLAQSSDWPFIMKTEQSTEFAMRHARTHLCRFFRLAKEIESGRPDATWVADLEWRDNVFPTIDYEVYA